MSTKQTPERRAAIRKIIRGRAVATQEELGRLLAAEGFDVTQATLSRDLAQLRAVRVSRPEGGTCYEIDPSYLPARTDPMRDLGERVISIAENGVLVVIQTEPGTASAVARALDVSRLPESLGTLAGDDTIFVAPSRGSSARALAKKLHVLFGKGELE